MAGTSPAQLIRPVHPETFTDCMEQLQEGYVYSVAATAGCLVNSIDRDRLGLDLQIIRPKGSVVEEQMLSVQLKNTTTIRPDPNKTHFSFQFKRRKHLEHLAKPRGTFKAVLVVMVTRPEQALWTVGNHEALTVSHCCYWVNLENHPVDPNVERPTVHVPVANRFDAAALVEIFDRMDRGESP